MFCNTKSKLNDRTIEYQTPLIFIYNTHDYSTNHEQNYKTKQTFLIELLNIKGHEIFKKNGEKTQQAHFLYVVHIW
jgi:hypothetical protein